MSDQDNSDRKARPRLEDKDISSGPQVGRRTLLAGAFGAVGLMGAGCVPQGPVYTPQPQPQPQPQPASFTDGDTGTYADPVGQGRSGVRTGLTDSDGGQYADMPGGGRQGSGLSDTDAGPYLTDAYGSGRRGF